MPQPEPLTVAEAGPPASEPDGTRAVHLVGVSRLFGSTPALIGVNLTLPLGEVVLVHGPNGAGKTTLLRILATALGPTYGGGTVLGFDLERQREEIRRRVELLGHRTRLYADLTARENLLFVAALQGLPGGVVTAALERVGLAREGEERVGGFSHGMRQRLALARAFLRRPQLLLLDEPYAGLDDAGKSLVDQLIVEARTEGRTVVLATHDVSRGEFLADRAIAMDAGRIASARLVADGLVPG